MNIVFTKPQSNESLKSFVEEHCRNEQTVGIGFLPVEPLFYDEDNDVERLLIEQRKYKERKEYQEADAIREKLKSWGYEIREMLTGTLWIFKPPTRKVNL